MIPDSNKEKQTSEGKCSPRFAFGDNWNRYVKVAFSPDRLEAAKESLRRFHQRENFDGVHVLDIGCGSGLSSLAFLELGANVTAFDFDRTAVETSRSLIDEQYKGSGRFTVSWGDALNLEFVKNLGDFDLIYSWGVLHHTGSMLKALKNVFQTAKSGTQIHLALYHERDRESTEYWQARKLRYCNGGNTIRRILEWTYLIKLLIWRPLSQFKNPLTRIYRCFYQDPPRGMSFLIDVRDWVGGYPYEAIDVEEMIDVAWSNQCIARRVKADSRGATASLNEFLFVKVAATP